MIETKNKFSFLYYVYPIETVSLVRNHSQFNRHHFLCVHASVIDTLLRLFIVHGLGTIFEIVI